MAQASRLHISLLLILGLLSFIPVTGQPVQKASYDMIIENGKIIDGTGNPWYSGDIGISGGRIAAVGALNMSEAKHRIDATGMFVTPGFIDIHTHSDGTILKIPTADNSVRQGLTTIVGGNCGGAPLPVADHLSQVRKTAISINYITLAGHNTIRNKAMGGVNRAPTEQEMAVMKQLLEQSLREGAFGLSTGLYYTPGNYAETEEIVELVKVVKQHGGIYVSHIRDESDYNIGLIAAVEEAIAIGEQAGVPVQISHLKCLGKPVWHQSGEVLKRIGAARSRGVDVRFDQYPYTASSTSLWGAVFPAWAQEGGTKAFLKRMEDNTTAARIREEISGNIERRGGASSLYIVREKARLSELAAKWNIEPADAAIRIQSNGGSAVISFNMTDEDVETIMKSPYGMIGSDGNITQPDNTGHPRSFGTFPRVLGIYVREKQILGWEEAVRKMTSAPAAQLGLHDRGLILQGMAADIVVFNPATVADLATYENPSLPPAGIHYVLVNGTLVIDRENHTGARPGKVLTPARLASNP